METQGLWDVILKHIGITVLVECVLVRRSLERRLFNKLCSFSSSLRLLLLLLSFSSVSFSADRRLLIEFGVYYVWFWFFTEELFCYQTEGIFSDGIWSGAMT